MILEVDTGIDDALALALAVRHPRIQLEAVVTSWGNIGLDLVNDNTLRVLDWLGANDVPVVSGADRPLVGDAIDALIRWQLATRAGELPPYDEALLRREMNLFPEWYVARHRRTALNAQQAQALEGIFALLVKSALAQPAVYVHRDYMPRNLMVSEPNPGVLDFQDAVMGPITYDVVSLLRDAFISWDEERMLDWSARYWEKAKRANLPVAQDYGEFWRALEWMGLQRHLKVLGIFARINYRDGKPKYLEDTPRFLTYARAVATRYRELAPLAKLLDEVAA